MLRATLWQPLLSSQRKGMTDVAEWEKHEGLGTNLGFLLSIATWSAAIRGKIHHQRREVVPCRFSRGGGGFWGNQSLFAKQTGVEALSFMMQTCSCTVQPKLGQQFVLPAGWHNERKHAKLLCSVISERGKRGAVKLFYWSLKILCLDQAGSFHIRAGDAYQKGKNKVVLKKVVKFFCVSSGTSWILLPLGKWSGLMYKEYKKLKDKTVSLKWVSKMKVLFQMSFNWRIFQYHW